MDCRPQQRFRESFGVHMQVDMVADAWPLTQFDAIKGELDGIQSKHKYWNYFTLNTKEKCKKINH